MQLIGLKAARGEGGLAALDEWQMEAERNAAEHDDAERARVRVVRGSAPSSPRAELSAPSWRPRKG